MDRVIIFLVLCIPLVLVSWRTLFSFKSHGFYRFLSWVCITWMLASNYRYWFVDPFSIHQLFSWLFLFVSLYFVLAGLVLMKKDGKPGLDRDEKTLYQFEKTTELVEKGIFKFIRHPLYSSLLFLTWGICFKYPDTEMLIVAFLSSVFLYFTAIFEEKECILFFGDKYSDYMKRTKRFIPFVI